MAETEADQELDEDGLLVQKYHSTVLVVLPPGGFGEQILRYSRSALYNVHVGTWSVSSETEELIKGRLQDEFLVDGPLGDVSMGDYSGVIVAGTESAEHPFAGDPKVLELVKAADADGKLLATWGNGVQVLARAGAVRGRKVTGSDGSRDVVRSGGGKFTARQIAITGHLVTARDESAGMRFGKALAEMVRI